MRDDYNLFDLAEDLTLPPGGARWQVWGLGVVLPLVAAGYGLIGCLTGHAKTFNVTPRGLPPLTPGFFLDVYGGAAVSLGACFSMRRCVHALSLVLGQPPTAGGPL